LQFYVISHGNDYAVPYCLTRLAAAYISQWIMNEGKHNEGF